jgi:hypothetical protein
MNQRYNRLVVRSGDDYSYSETTKLRETPKAYEYQGSGENHYWPRRNTAMDMVIMS